VCAFFVFQQLSKSCGAMTRHDTASLRIFDPGKDEA
jgi:hypothetical protein